MRRPEDSVHSGSSSNSRLAYRPLLRLRQLPRIGLCPKLCRHDTRIVWNRRRHPAADRRSGPCASPGNGGKARTRREQTHNGSVNCRHSPTNTGPKDKVRALEAGKFAPCAAGGGSVDKLQAPTAPGMLARSRMSRGLRSRTRAYAERSGATHGNSRASRRRRSPRARARCSTSRRRCVLPGSNSRHRTSIGVRVGGLWSFLAWDELASHGFGCARSCRRSSCPNRAAAATLRLFDFCRMLHCVQRVMRTTVSE
ncbi:hypothetical protein BV20DRAFT_523742 [Pilatotrama ljubarskyi]|nr:hypothetical protein BV20DRAFT_523742 [Pilatotrama ljubarskyi]